MNGTTTEVYDGQMPSYNDAYDPMPLFQGWAEEVKYFAPTNGKKARLNIRISCRHPLSTQRGEMESKSWYSMTFWEDKAIELEQYHADKLLVEGGPIRVGGWPRIRTYKDADGNDQQAKTPELASPWVDTDFLINFTTDGSPADNDWEQML